MRAWHVEAPGPLSGHPLRLHTADDIPRPGPGELLLQVLACGLCRTDLHVTEGDLPPHRPGVTPGHEVVGEVAALDRAGTLAITGIYFTGIPPLNDGRHLFQERQLRSTTSNTRADAREFLSFAADHKLAVTVHPYPLGAADRALQDLEAGRFGGAAVLTP